MKSQTCLRALRLRHSVPLTELAKAAGLSNQYISRAELGQVPATQRLEHQIGIAVERVIVKRKNDLLALEKEYRFCKGRLLRTIEDARDEQ